MAQIIITKDFNQDDFKKDWHLFDSIYYRSGTPPGGEIRPASASFISPGSFYITTPANLYSTVKSVDIFTDSNMWVELFMYTPFSQNMAGGVYRRHDIINNTDTLKKVTFDLGEGIVMPENSRIAIRYCGLDGLAITPLPKFSMSANIDLKSIDSDYNKRYKLDIYGDSITWAVGGLTANPQYSGFPAFGCEYFPTLVRDYLEDKFKTSIKTTTHSFGGSNTSGMLQLINTMGGAPYSDIAFISEGMNDSGTTANISTSVYTANINKIFNKIKNRNNDATVFIFAPSSTDDSAGRPNIQAYRDALKTLFTDVLGGTMSNVGGGINGYSATNKIIFVDLSTAYPSTDATFFSDSSPRIHPNVLKGHPAIFNIIKPVIDACPWTILK